MKRERLIEDMQNVEEIMIKTADRVDIWQDRFIYYIARAIYDILDTLLKKG